MSIFDGLFSHDRKAADTTALPSLRDYVSGSSNLPTDRQDSYALAGPGSAQPSPVRSAAALPVPPPAVRKRPGPFDDDHYRQTMLALASGFFSGNGLGEGLANATRTLAASTADLNKTERPIIGGPDNAFEVMTNPDGTHLLKPMQPAVDYLKAKKFDPRTIADIHGRVMYAIGQLPEDQQAHAFDDVRLNPQLYGVDQDKLPDHWSPAYGSIIGSMGMNVSQAQGHQLAAVAEGHRDKDRADRTVIAGRRADAITRQGDQRINLAGQALNLRKGKGGKTGRAASPAVSAMSTADLLAMIGH